MFEDQNQGQQTTDSPQQQAEPPAVSNVRLANTAPPTVVTPTAPPLASSMASAAETPARPFAENQVTPPPSEARTVNLESAYIPTNPPAAKGEESTPVSRPTASAMLASSDEGQLIKLKQQALQGLAPLVDDLDQPPEEKFKTLMMMIQASDNPEYIQDAYSEANKIADEKARAQALLDVVNEINYFTQHQADQKLED